MDKNFFYSCMDCNLTSCKNRLTIFRMLNDRCIHSFLFLQELFKHPDEFVLIVAEDGKELFVDRQRLLQGHFI